MAIPGKHWFVSKGHKKNYQNAPNGLLESALFCPLSFYKLRKLSVFYSGGNGQ